MTAVSATGEGAARITTITVDVSPTRDGTLGGTTALDDDLIGSLVELDISGYATSFIIDNDESSKTITVRGKWDGVVAVDDYIKIYPRQRPLGNIWLGGGANS